MARAGTVTLDEIAGRLRRLGEGVRTRVAAEAVLAGADVVRDAVQQRAPYGEKTGRERGARALHLRENIMVYKARARFLGEERVLVGPSKDVFWGYFLEAGHKTAGPHLVKQGRNPKRGGRLATGFVAPRPFVMPAFIESRDAAIHEALRTAERLVAAEVARAR